MFGILTAGVWALAAGVASCAGAVKWRKHRRRERRGGGRGCKGGCVKGGSLAGVNTDTLGGTSGSAATKEARAEVMNFGATTPRTKDVLRPVEAAPGVQVGGAAEEGFRTAIVEEVATFGPAILPLVLRPQAPEREATPVTKPLPFGPAVVRLTGQTGTKEALLPILRAPVRFEEL
jgi:hypothetical protein